MTRITAEKFRSVSPGRAKNVRSSTPSAMVNEDIFSFIPEDKLLVMENQHSGDCHGTKTKRGHHAAAGKAHRSAAPFMQGISARKSKPGFVSDHLGALALRFGIGRNNATIQPGLYYTGNPGAGSPVLVTANYRLTVDALRRELTGISTWVLIIDTGGINIWCAAGKGTFSAQNIANTLNRSDLDRLAPSAPLVLPQLSASGVDANELASLTGRRILFGPVYARDIPRFLESGFKKDTAMRAVRFATPERAVLVPVELMHTAKLQFATLLLSVILACR